MLFFGDVAAMGDFDSDDFAMGLDVDCAVGDCAVGDCSVGDCGVGNCGVGWAADGVGAMTIVKVAANTTRVG